MRQSDLTECAAKGKSSCNLEPCVKKAGMDGQAMYKRTGHLGVAAQLCSYNMMLLWCRPSHYRHTNPDLGNLQGKMRYSHGEVSSWEALIC